VTEPNYPPLITSIPKEEVDENGTYVYQVEAIDLNKDDILHYSTTISPLGLKIDENTGLINWEADTLYTQNVLTFNPQCYTLPKGAESSPIGDSNNSYILPLFQDVKDAIHKGSDYIAPQTLSWDNRNSCLGCHVQTQTLVGLQASKDKAIVDEDVAEHLLAKILDSQVSDGSIRRSHASYSKTQTGFALWALSYVPDRNRTFSVREKALNYFYTNKISAVSSTYWTPDHASGWLRTSDALTAIIALSANKYINDAKKQTLSESQQDIVNKYTIELPKIFQFLEERGTSNDNILNALRMVGMAEAKNQLIDINQITRANQALSNMESLLRSRQNIDGGWTTNLTGSVSDPLTSAWVGFALNYRNLNIDDDVVINNIQYLLDTQESNGIWKTNSGLFSTHLGTTSLVMAYLPIALDFLGHPDISVGNIVLNENTMELSATVLNRGLGDIYVPIDVQFYNGSVSEENLLGTIDSDTESTAIITLDDLPDRDVLVVFNTTLETSECTVSNNQAIAPLIQIHATDSKGLSAQQTFLINVLDVNEAPIIISEILPNLTIGVDYTYILEISDNDVGDSHTYKLINPPEGLFIDPHSGQIQYDISLVVAGSYEIEAHVKDLRGLFTTKLLSLIVEENTIPIITSEPITSIHVGEVYKYIVEATDNDNDTLTYSLYISPLTMDINDSSGVIVWKSTSNYVGEQEMKIVVNDGRGGEAIQSFTLNILPNNAPMITSEAISISTVEEVYEYQVTAVDIDNDILTYTLNKAPYGMSIDTTGMISYLPKFEDRGSHGIEIEVVDNWGAKGIQEYILIVTPKQDLGPIITILNNNPLIVQLGKDYIEFGANANDDVDGVVPIQISTNVDINTLGKYVTSYSAIDSQNNKTIAYRDVYIVDENHTIPDTTAPILNLLGENPQRVNLGDGDIDVERSDSIDTSVKGSYEVIYTATDSQGNTASITRIVMVIDENSIDDEAPVIIVLGDNPLVMYEGTTFVDAGVKVIDDHDGNLGYSISHNVNSNQVGKYTVYYTNTLAKIKIQNNRNN
jgi:hypothetical protein